MNKLPISNIILFLITLASTLFAGALQQGQNPLDNPSSIWMGIPFSLSLLTILGAHEFGHYYMSKKHLMDVTLPYFIPAPSAIGTFGAFIKIKSPIMDRKALIDIGAAGPIAGIIIALPLLFAGLMLSEIKPQVTDQGIQLGTSILFMVSNFIVHGFIPEDANLILHPVAFSGWIGILVTCLNLLPVGQLDGGHVAYAVLGSRHKLVARSVIIVLMGLGLWSWRGWLVWAAILLIMGINHPPVLYEWIPLDRKRKILGWLTLAVFIVTFTPVPF
jgi:membrane-associated protease RseP (regulator of RpoE activity)